MKSSNVVLIEISIKLEIFMLHDCTYLHCFVGAEQLVCFTYSCSYFLADSLQSVVVTEGFADRLLQFCLQVWIHESFVVTANYRIDAQIDWEVRILRLLTFC